MKNHTLLVLVNAPINSMRLSSHWDSPDSGESLILVHSLNAATEAGFNKMVFVVDRLIRHELQIILTAKLDHKLELIFVEKDINDLPVLPDSYLDYLTSWGAAQEVLRAKPYIDEPFVVINSNNYYGRQDFASALEFTRKQSPAFGIFCYPLINTLSNFGGVDRQICFTSDGRDTFAEHILIRDIRKDFRGRLSSQAPMGIIEPLNENLPVSMNMFGLDPRFFEVAEKALTGFIKNYQSEQNSELSILQVLQNTESAPAVPARILILDTNWVGLNYKADRILAGHKLLEKSNARIHSNYQRQHLAISRELREHLVML